GWWQDMYFGWYFVFDPVLVARSLAGDHSWVGAFLDSVRPEAEPDAAPVRFSDREGAVPMDPERAFLQALIAAPDSIEGRLVYADWLEERGDGRAEYLRLECQLKSLGDADGRRGPIEAKLKELRFSLPQDWLVWVRWPGYGEFAPALPSVTHRLVPLNGAAMRMPRGVSWASFSHDGQ